MDDDKLAKMRIARQEILNGQSPRERGDEKMRLALDWIYRWGYSSPKVIELIGGAARSGLSARLVKRGLLRSTRTESGGGLKGVPDALLTLTELGQQEIERISEKLLQYDLDPYKINQLKLRHDILAQTATAKALSNSSIQDFRTERELAQRSQQGFKQPDVLWSMSGLRVAVEIELTAKWDRILDQFVDSCINALSSQNEKEPRFNQILLATDSPAISKRYKAAFESGQTYGIWKKDDKAGRWKMDGSRKVPDWIEGKFVCKLFD